MAGDELQDRCKALLTELGIIHPDQAISVSPLTGGVASDIARVETADRIYCVKFALPKLRVEADWQAPVHRNFAEYEWLRFAQSVQPQCAPKLFGHSGTKHGDRCSR